METIKVTKENFAATVRQGIVVLDFWDPACVSCRSFGRTFATFAGRHPDVLFGRVDARANRALAESFGVRVLPTLFVLRDGVLIDSHPAEAPRAALDELLDEVRALDMQALRRTVGSTRRATTSSRSWLKDVFEKWRALRRRRASAGVLVPGAMGSAGASRQ
jgi:thioredoxin 1